MKKATIVHATFLLAVTLAMILSSAGCREKSEAPMRPDEARELCTRLWTGYIEGVKGLQLEKIITWFTKDAVLIYPDMAPLRSRDTLHAFFAKILPGVKIHEMTFMLERFDVIGTKAYTFVTINELEEVGGEPPVRALARCGVVWEQQTDKSWQIAHFLVNYLKL